MWQLNLNNGNLKKNRMFEILRFFIFIFFVIVVHVCQASQISDRIEVSYQPIINGKIIEDGGTQMLIATPGNAKAYIDNSGIELIPQTPIEVSYVDFGAKKTFQVAELSNGEKVYTEKNFSEYPEITITNETEKILGYTCTKATSVLRSNSIDIWFTTELQAKGTPAMSYGLVDGLVLKVVRNGNYALEATAVKLMENEREKLVPDDLGEKVTEALYRYKVTNSFVTTVSVFSDEQISWGNTIDNPTGEQVHKVYRFAGGTVILKKIKLPEVTPDYQVFAELTQYSNGDAYDRAGSVFMIPQNKEQSFFDALVKGVESVPAFQAANGKKYYGTVATPFYEPTVELIRFFTPFGINYYNDKVEVYNQEWEQKTYYKQEITELLPLLKGEVWIGTYIGNYDKGGHKVSLDFKYYPGNRTVEEKNDESETWIYPLFNTLNIMEMAGQEYATMFENDSLEVNFLVPENTKNIYLRYISTGHGGWGGGDEFNKKINEIFVDGDRVFSYIPWNCNCGTERKYNPASGNFWNGMSSSDYSRSGWCPGEASNPVYIPLNMINAGEHTLKVAIPIGAREKGSFSSWNISGVLIGEKE